MVSMYAKSEGRHISLDKETRKKLQVTTPSVIPSLLLAIGVCCVSTAGVIARPAFQEASPLAVAAWRLGLAAVFFQLLALWDTSRGRFKTVLTRPEQRRLGLAGLVLAAHFVLWFASLQMTSVSISTLFVCTTPLWTALHGLVRGKNKLDFRFCTSFVLALLGIVLIVQPQGLRHNTHTWLGDLLATAGGASIAIYLIAMDGLQHIPSRDLVRATYSGAALWLWAALVLTERVTLHYPIAVWSAVILLALVPQICGHTLLNNALRHFRADAVAFSILAEPVITAILAHFVLGERLVLVQIIGGGFVLVALGLVLMQGQRTPTKIVSAVEL